MLDQNTDRMWYVIGAIVIGAAIIAMGLNIFSDSFDSVEDNYASVMGIAGDNVLNVGAIPELPVEVFKYNEIEGGYEVVGFDFEYIDEYMNGVQPTRIKIPSEYNCEPVLKIGKGSLLNDSVEGSTRRYQPIFENISQVEFPDTLIEIGERAFAVTISNDRRWSEHMPNTEWHDDSIHTVITGELVIPNSVRKIGQYAFIGNNITSVQLSTSMDSVEMGTFHSNDLRLIDIPDNIVRLGAYSFENNRLTDVSLPNNIETISTAAFYINRLDSIDIPNGLRTLGNRAFNNNIFPDEDAFFYSIDDPSILVSYAGRNRDEVVIPENVKAISSQAFHGNRLKSIVIPDSVESIGNGAFQLNNLTEVVIPNITTNVVSNAFTRNGVRGDSIGTGSISRAGHWLLQHDDELDNYYWMLQD